MIRILRVAISVILFAVVLAFVAARTDMQSVFTALSGLQVGAVLLALGSLFAGTALASVRVKLVADDLGYRLTWRDSAAALGLGHIAGAMFFQIARQLAARGVYLSRRGLSVGATVLMVGYERLLSLTVSLALALTGAWVVFGRLAIDVETGGGALLKLAAGIALAVLAGAWLGWGRAALAGASALVGASPAYRLARSTVLSLAIQVSMAFAYISLAQALAPEVPLADLARLNMVL